MTPAMSLALAESVVTMFGAVRIELPGHVIRVLDGASEVTFGGEIYGGIDPLYGTLGTADAMSDGAGDEAPAVSFGFLPPDATAIAGLANPLAQGSPVRMIVGAVANGAVVADPLTLFEGVLDQIDLDVGAGQSLDINCVSAMERFFDNQEGVRLSPTHHKSVWPGETGMDQVTGVTRKVYWGTAAPAGTASIAVGGGGGVGLAGLREILARQV